jgi:virulence factor Mce-like protein
MATTTPPSPPLPGPVPPPPDRPARPLRTSPPNTRRWVAAGSLGLVVLIVAYIVFSSGGGAEYNLIFSNASQLVRGDQVQVGGVPVGTISNIALTPSYKARVTIHVDSSLTPLHEGTTAQIRVPSLSSVANRYIALTLGPNNRPALPSGATLRGPAIQGTVDLDQLFDTFNPRTRKGLQEFFQGGAELYAGATEAARISSEYFSPSLAAADHVFSELTSDQQTFTAFIVQASKTLSTIAVHHEQLTSLIGNSNTTFQALASEQANLQQGVAQLPATLHQANSTFAEAPATFAALRKFETVAKPNTTMLAEFFARLRPLLVVAQPVLHDLSLAISRPGPSNDLTDFALALPGLAKSLASGSPDAVKALQESVPQTAFFGPYSPDIQGAVRDFGTAAGYYDANGHYARITAAGPGEPADAPAAALSGGRRDAAAGRRLGTLHRQRPARLRPRAGTVMNRRRSNSLAASPLLIGALALLIGVVAVFISYNANNGLPFVPTYDIKVALPEASGLQPGNQVRLAGDRVGRVTALEPHEDPATGRVTVIAGLKLEKGVQPLPVDTTTEVLSVSSIGLKYLELTKGHSSQELAPGQTIPVSQSREPVQIQDFFNMFNKQTRIASQENLNTFGDAFAGRGLGLNNTIATLRPLVYNAIPVLHNLSEPQTGLRQLFIALDKAATETAPVAEEQAAFFAQLDTFFTAFAGVSPSLEKTIVGGPPALSQAIYSLPYEAPFVEKFTEFMHLLRPSASILTTAAAPLGHAVQVGAVNLKAATSFNSLLAKSLVATQAFAKNPVVALGLEEIAHFAQLGSPLLAGIAPAQTNCNYITLAARNVASLFAENLGVGTAGRALPVLSPSGPNNEGLPASAPANGPSVEHETTPSGPGKLIDNNHLHFTPYPYVGGPGQPRECEAGNQTYAIGKAVIGNTSTTLGTNHEATKRSQNLFGETYPSSTLKSFPKEGTSDGKGKQG